MDGSDGCLDPDGRFKKLKLSAGLLCKRRVTTKTYSRRIELNQAFKQAQPLPFLPASPTTSGHAFESQGPESGTRPALVDQLPQERVANDGIASSGGGGERFA